MGIGRSIAVGVLALFLAMTVASPQATAQQQQRPVVAQTRPRRATGRTDWHDSWQDLIN